MLAFLATGVNPPITTLKSFLHLLNDSDFDFEEELELENLRQMVVRRIRENTQSDAQLNELDIKIALLVQNHITLDEVLKTTTSLTKKKAQRRMSMPVSATSNPYTLKSLDRESRDRLVLYQQLFYLLQTQPAYFSRLFFMMSKTGLFTDRIKKQIEGVVLTMFGYAQNSREEYLLLKLFKVKQGTRVHGPWTRQRGPSTIYLPNPSLNAFCSNLFSRKSTRS